ncbi:hypothetical protein PVAG01_05268 [Phlyctema vagabunda]|uniref:DUF7730 domain-containing protein n=1 Tax=Phlyctema vagabunda TaxID=108571 RepID=A0ABR4PJK8_9HELO
MELPVEVAAEIANIDSKTYRLMGRARFLDLPAEIRLEIYGYLLTNRSPARNGRGGDIHAVQIVDSRERRENNYGPYMRYHEGHGDEHGPARAERNSAKYLHVALLQTCRKIADEGSDFLYSQNTFSINLARESFAPTYRLFRDNDFYLMNPIKNMFNGEQTRSYLAELSYVAFFRQIGVQNTNTIQHLQIFANDTEEYAIAMPLLTEVVKQHIPGLKTVVFYLAVKHEDERSYNRSEYVSYFTRTETAMDMDDSFDGSNFSEIQFNPDSPHRATGHFRPMYATLDEFSRNITSLDAFEYRGHWHFMKHDMNGQGFTSRWAMMATDRFEAQVKRRSHERAWRENLNVREKDYPTALNTRLLRWIDYDGEFLDDV